MSILRISSVPQYGVVLEKHADKEHSIFHDVYKGAAKNVCDIIEQNKKILSIAEENPNAYGSKASNDCFINPIIAFVGDRGSGKSSAMSSFANFLENCTEQNSCSWIQNKEIEKIFLENNFYVLPTIDASQLGLNQTVIGNISASMYKIYQNYRHKMSVDEQRNFVSSVKEVNNISALYNTGEWFKPSDRLLDDTKNICDLKEKVTTMISQFLKFTVKKFEPQNTHLILKIDDLDMGIKNCFSILEEIRKFLTIPNLIILTAVDSKQLKCIVKTNFNRNIYEKNSPDDTWFGEELSYRYLEKLFPYKRQHYMPELTLDKLKSTLAIHFLYNSATSSSEDKYGDGFWGKFYQTNELEHIKYKDKVRPSILEAILHLIWRKTMIIPTCNRYGEYPIIPKNLRSLCNFVIFLRSMNDIALKQENGDFSISSFKDFKENKNNVRSNLEKNIDTFQKYLIEHIMPINHIHHNSEDCELSKVLLEIVESIIFVPLENMNAKIVGDILYSINSIKNGKYYKLFSNNSLEDSKNDETNNTYTINLLNDTEYPDVIGIGEVMYVLGKLEKHTRSSYIRYLISLIKTLWSTRMARELFVVGCNNLNSQNFEPDTDYITTSFRCVVGGFIFNPEHIRLCNSNIPILNWEFFEGSQDITPTQEICTLFACNSSNEKILPNGKCSFVPANKAEKFNVKNVSMKTWRSHLKEGIPYYRYSSDIKNDRLFVAHPLAFFTNLLSLKNTESRGINSNGALWNELKAWQKEYILILPFYSFDFMSLFYDELQKELRASYDSTPDILVLIEKFIKSLYQIIPPLLYYIPSNTNLTNPINSIKACLNKAGVYDFRKTECINLCNSLLQEAEKAKSTNKSKNESLLNNLKTKLEVFDYLDKNTMKNIIEMIDKIGTDTKNIALLSALKENIQNLYQHQEGTDTIDNTEEILK